jgi:hypothetical protein
MLMWGFVIVAMAFILIGSAFGIKPLYLIIIGCVTTYLWVLYASGGFKNASNFNFAAGFGLMFVIFASPGICLAAFCGQKIFNHFKSREP